MPETIKNAQIMHNYANLCIINYEFQKTILFCFLCLIMTKVFIKFQPNPINDFPRESETERQTKLKSREIKYERLYLLLTPPNTNKFEFLSHI